MAAPVKTCSLCWAFILNEKSYRSLTSGSSKIQYKSIFEHLPADSSLLHYACKLCVNKMNRVCKLNDDILTKAVALREERDKIFDVIMGLPGVKAIKDRYKKTPTSMGKTRQLVKTTPTPKGKIKSGLFVTPSPKKRHVSIASVSVKSQPSDPTQDQLVQPLSCSKATQTTTSEDFDVKVTVRYNGKERSKIIREEYLKIVVKAILNNSTPKAVLKHFSTNAGYKTEILEFVCKELNLEVTQLLKQNEVEVFQGHGQNNNNLMNFDWTQKELSLKTKAPMFHSIMTKIVQSNHLTLPRMMTAASILLYARSQRQNQLQYILGLIADKCGLTKEGLSILHDIGVTVSSSSIHRKKKKLVTQQEALVKEVMTNYVRSVERKAKTDKSLEVVLRDHDYYEFPAADMEVENLVQTEENLSGNIKCKSIEILGDNIDVTITPSKMTSESQRQSLHWFLLLVKQKRVVVDDNDILTSDYEQRDICSVPNLSWFPTREMFQSLLGNFAFHIAHTILKYIPFLSSAVKPYPRYIMHKHFEEMKDKSVFLNCDLIEASENTSQGMIQILQNIHDISIPHLRVDQQEKQILERVVFGGDVLTNERAFSAQEAMQNCKDPFEALLGVIHRPEGLHRLMNFTLGIYQLFYKEQSASDRGSLYQLRNLINRRTVTGPDDVVQNFRSHHQFVDDVADAYVISAFLDIFDMENMQSKPVNGPVFSLMSDRDIVEWVTKSAFSVIENFQLDTSDIFSELLSDIDAMDKDDNNISAMHNGVDYICPMCGNHYKKTGWLRKHLQKKHQWQFHQS